MCLALNSERLIKRGRKSLRVMHVRQAGGEAGRQAVPECEEVTNKQLQSRQSFTSPRLTLPPSSQP